MELDSELSKIKDSSHGHLSEKYQDILTGPRLNPNDFLSWQLNCVVFSCPELGPYIRLENRRFQTGRKKGKERKSFGNCIVLR